MVNEYAEEEHKGNIVGLKEALIGSCRTRIPVPLLLYRLVSKVGFFFVVFKRLHQVDEFGTVFIHKEVEVADRVTTLKTKQGLIGACYSMRGVAVSVSARRPPTHTQNGIVRLEIYPFFFKFLNGSEIDRI